MAKRVLKPKMERPPTPSGLLELRATWENCKRCAACDHRQKVVLGIGPSPCRVMLIGQYPGKDEDVAGVPFQGVGGRYTKAALALAGLDHEQVFLDNVMACRMPNPKKEQIEACRPRLEDTISIVKPSLIIAAGAVATKWLAGSNKGPLAGTRGAFQDRSVFYTTHPMEPVRAGSPETEAKSIQKIRTEYKLLGEFARELGLLPPLAE